MSTRNWAARICLLSTRPREGAPAVTSPWRHWALCNCSLLIPITFQSWLCDPLWLTL